MDGNLSSYLLANFSEEFCRSSYTLDSLPEVICHQSCTLSSQERSEVGHPSNKCETNHLPSKASETYVVCPLRGVSQTNYHVDVPFCTAQVDEKSAVESQRLLSSEVLPSSVTKSDKKSLEVLQARVAIDEKAIDSYPGITSLEEKIFDQSCNSSFGGRMGLSPSYMGAKIFNSLKTECSSPTKAGAPSHNSTDEDTSIAGINIPALRQRPTEGSSMNSTNLKQKSVPVSFFEQSDFNFIASTSKLLHCDVKMSSSQIQDVFETGENCFLLRKDEKKQDVELKAHNDHADGKETPLLHCGNLADHSKLRENCEQSSASLILHNSDMKIMCTKKHVVTEERHGNDDQKRHVDGEFNFYSSNEPTGEKSSFDSGVEPSGKVSSPTMNYDSSETLNFISSDKKYISQVQYLPQEVHSLKPEHEIQVRAKEVQDYSCRGEKSLSDVSRTEFESNEVVQVGQSVPKEEIQLRFSQTELGRGSECDLSIFINRNSFVVQPEQIFVPAEDELDKYSQKVQILKHTQIESTDTQEIMPTENEELQKNILSVSKESNNSNVQTGCEEFPKDMQSETKVLGNVRPDDEQRDFEDDPYPSIVSSDSGVFAPICGSDKDDIFTHRSSVEVSSFSECEEFESLQSELLSSLTEANDVFTFSFNSPLSGKVFRDDMGVPQASEIPSPFRSDDSTDGKYTELARRDSDNLENANESFDTSFTEKILNKIALLGSSEKIMDSNVAAKVVCNENSPLKRSQSDSCKEMGDESSQNNSLLHFSQSASEKYSSLCFNKDKKREGSNCRYEDCAKLDIVSPSTDRTSIDECSVFDMTGKLTKSVGIPTLVPSKSILEKSNDTPSVAIKTGVGRSELDALAGAVQLSEDLKNAIRRAIEKEEAIRERQANGINEDKSDEETDEGSEIYLKKSTTIVRNELNERITNRKMETDMKMSGCKNDKNEEINEVTNQYASDKYSIHNPNVLKLSHNNEKTLKTMMKSCEAEQAPSPSNSVEQNDLHIDMNNRLFALRQQLNLQKKTSVGSMTDSSNLLSDYLRIQLRISSLLSEVKTISKEARNSRNEFSSLQTRTNNICEERDDLLRLRDSLLNV